MAETKPEEEKKDEVRSPLLDEVRAERAKLEKARAEAKAEGNRLEKLRAEQLMSGTAGIREDPVVVKEESDKEYAKRLISRPYGDAKVETPEE